MDKRFNWLFIKINNNINYFLNSLIINYNYKSPLFTNIKNLNIKNSNFYNSFFSTISIFLINLKIYNLKFVNHLSSTIKVNKYLYQNYSNTYNINNLSTFSINFCLFINCSNIEQSGGAISSFESILNISLINSEFYRCSSEVNGGAIFISESYHSIIINCCFHKCKSRDLGQSILISTPLKKNKLFNIEFCDFTDNSNYKSKYIFLISGSRQIFHNLNISFNKLNNGCGFVSYYPINLSLLYNNFISNSGLTLFNRKELPISKEIYNYCNFINNNIYKGEFFNVQVFAESSNLIFKSNLFSYFAIVSIDSHFNIHKSFFDIDSKDILFKLGEDFIPIIFEECLFLQDNLKPNFPNISINYACQIYPGPHILTYLQPVDAVIEFAKNSLKNQHVFGFLIALLTIFIIFTFIYYKKKLNKRFRR